VFFNCAAIDDFKIACSSIVPLLTILKLHVPQLCR
jgi:hypothetical protein